MLLVTRMQESRVRWNSRYALWVITAIAAIFLLGVAYWMTPALPPQLQENVDTTALGDAKTRREIAKLDIDLHYASRIIQFVPLLVAFLGGLVTYYFSNRLNELKSAADRDAERFSALVENRAKAYAQAYTMLSPTALFFPQPGVDPGVPPDAGASDMALQPAGKEASDEAMLPAARASEIRGPKDPELTPDDCARMGRHLASWYFGPGGLLMTEESRDAYFTLMEALRRAAAKKEGLAVQTVEEHVKAISLTLMTGYRRDLAQKGYAVFEKLEAKQPVKPDDLDGWLFGCEASSASAEQSDDLKTARVTAERFKDFVLIQTLASRFRTTLTNDIGSRKPPKPSPAERYREEADQD